ncbi:hypothetical protein FCU45_08755 [Sulfurimonas crateris]|uniref:2-Component system ADP-ribosyltransferase domain-containing protein n=2 Tax=Sulfurimonas crateris TaxID=2574727 RepID=A0A4U2Z6G0_9BACT|nr:hypothetical protein FCU45_08755 [Sulfurimonas crateris]
MYLLQINRIKLQDYIQRGLIVPDKYLDENKEIDTQSKNPNFLVVSDGYIKELDEYQILLELIFTDEEKKRLQEVDGIYYFDFPLPITRIKKVYVQNQQIIKHIDVQIQNGENGFLPKNLFSVYLKNKKPIFEQREYKPLQDDIAIDNFEEQIRVFDKRMGMFAFMKNSEVYYCDDVSKIANYSERYFSTLSKLLEKPLDDKIFEELNILKQNEEFKKLLYSTAQIDKEFIIKESQKIEDSELKSIFLEMISPTGTRKALKSLLEKNDIEHYLIGLVYYFRQKDSNKKDNFKIDIKSLIPYEVAEISLAILGIYFGYTILRSEEKVEIKDKYFKKLFKKDKLNMKFTLESKLDYITIETIYDYCFKDKIKGYEYEYLPYPNQPKSVKITQNKNYGVKRETYFDTEYITIEKFKIKRQKVFLK